MMYTAILSLSELLFPRDPARLQVPKVILLAALKGTAIEVVAIVMRCLLRPATSHVGMGSVPALVTIGVWTLVVVTGLPAFELLEVIM